MFKRHYGINASLIAQERRLMFDAAALVTAEAVSDQTESSDATDTAQSSDADQQLSTEALVAALATGESNRNEIYVIDGSVENQEQLLASIPASASVYILVPNQDGIEQLTTLLASSDSIDALHLISHGSEGTVQLGSTLLTSDNLEDYQAEFAQLATLFADDADILLYGCDVGAEEGLALLSGLAAALDVDIASSDDITGISGDWELEVQLGAIQTTTFTAEQWQSDLLLGDLINTTPVALPDIAIVDEDGSTIINVLANDIDLDGDAIHVTSATALFGTVTINANNTLTYTPTFNFFGVDTITYTIADEHGLLGVPSTVVVTVNPVNDIIMAVLPTIDVFDEDEPLIFAEALGTAISIGDIDGSIAEVTLSVPVGTLTLAQTTGLTISQGDGVNDSNLTMSGSIADINAALDGLVYTPDADYNGPVTLTIGLTDTLMDLPITLELPLGISAVADIVDDVITVDKDEPTSFNVLANDTFENVNRVVDSYTAPSHGTVIIDAAGNAIYTPDDGFTGTDAFTYTVLSNGTYETATVTIDIENPPDASDDTATTDEDTPVTIDVLSNDSDLDGDSLSVTSAVAANGSVVINADGTLTYSPDNNFNGSDTITYTITDGNGNTASASVVVTVNPVNDAPTAVDQSVTTDEDTPITVDVISSATDVDGNSLSTISAIATNGTVAINADGTLTYTPNANFNGSDTITYTISDGNGGTASATVAVTINAVNDAPTATDSTASTDEDTPVTLAVLDNASDVEGDTVTVTNASATNGTVTINADGTITYTPNVNFNGTDTITYTISDGNGGTTTATVTVTVNAVNDAPQSADETVTTDEDTPVTINVLSNDNDVDGDVLSVTSASATHGSVLINADGTLTYTPEPDFNGSDTITYTVSDTSGLTSTAEVSISVAAVSDAVDDDSTTLEDQPSIFNVFDNDLFTSTDLTLDSYTQPANGTLVIDSNGLATYTPDLHFVGTDSFTYTVIANGIAETATVTIDVTADEPPEISAQQETLAQSSGQTEFSLANGNAIVITDDSPLVIVTLDAGSDTITLTNTTDITVILGQSSGDNQLIITGSVDAINQALEGLIVNHGSTPASLTIEVSDGHSFDGWQIDIVDSLTGDNNSHNYFIPASFNPLLTGEYSDSAYVVSTSTPSHGEVVISDSGEISYIPDVKYRGSDTFTYTINDNGQLITKEVVVYVGNNKMPGEGGDIDYDALNLWIQSRNANSTAYGATDIVIPEDFSFSLSGLPDLNEADFEALDVDSFSALHGNLTLNADGSISYEADPDYNGPETLSYTLIATTELQESGSISSIINRGNAPLPNVSVSWTLSDTDTGHSVVQLTGSATNLDAVLGGLVKLPDLNSNIPITIQLELNELLQLESILVSVDVTVGEVTDAIDDIASTSANISTTFNILANDTFSDPDATITAVTSPANGQISVDSDGNVTYQPDLGFSGTDSFTYSISAGGSIETATVVVTVSANSDPIAGVLDSQTAFDNAYVLISTAQAFVDADIFDVLTYSTTDLPDGLTIDPTTGVITGQLSNDASTAVANGEYTITVTATDLSGAASSASFTLTAQNIAPVASASVVLGQEDQSLTIDALANVLDADNDTLTLQSASAVNGTISINVDGSITYTPDANYYGTDTITYTVSDSDGDQTTGTITVTLAPVTDLPTITLPSIDLLDEDTPLIFANLLGQQISVGDVDGAVLDIRLSVPVGAISLTQTAGLDISEGDSSGDSTLRFSGTVADINAALNSLIYTPGEDYNGNVDLSIELGQLSQLLSVNATLPIGIAAVVDITDDNVTIDEDQSASFNVLDNDTFENSGRYVDSYTSASYGTVTINAQGDVIYTPLSDYSGTDSFTYTVYSNGTYETATVTITINPVNDAPIGVDDSATTDEDTPVTIDVLANDSDPESDSLTVNSASASNGVVSFNADGTITYTPNANFNGSDTIIYTVSDGNGGSTTATVAVTVNAVNDAPTATDSTATTDEDTPVTLSVLDNASDVEGDTLSVTTASATNGTVTINADGTITYTPNANFNGSDTITYTVSDGNGGTTTATVAVTVNAVNDAPTAVDSTATTDEDTPITLSVLDNASDVEGDTLSVTTASATNGTVTINADGTITYTPNANFNGSDTITYTVSDGNGGTTTATVAVTVNAVNDAPTATDSTASTDEDTPVTLSVLDNASDVEGDTLSVTTASATNGTVTINADGTITYTPNANFNGSDTITYTVSDGNSGSTTATVAVTVNAVNDAPTANNDITQTDEDTPVTIDVLANDVDVDGDTLTVTSATASSGVITINADNTITYTPNPNFNGTDTVIYTISDGNGGTAQATLQIDVEPVNDSPIVTSSSAQTDEDTAITIDALANASDVEGDSLSISAASASNGTVSVNPDGTLTYTPNANFYGSDTINYTVTDTQGATTTATIAITVNAVNDAPIAADDIATTNEDTAVTMNVLDNDTDPDGDSLTITQATASSGTVQINADGTLTYTPNNNFYGSDTINYTITDANGATSTATVAITVNPVNDTPDGIDDSAITAEDTPVTIDVLANDTDVENDELSVTHVSAANGNVVINADGTITYTPNTNFNGNDTISYTLTDANGASSTAIVAVTVTALNDEPSAVDDTAITDEDVPVNIDVLANDSDVDGDDLVIIQADADNGSIVIETDGTLTYTPDANFNGFDTITYTISDGQGGTSTASVSVVVNAVNDGPGANNDIATTTEDTAVTIDVLTNDTSDDGGPLSITSASADNGDVVINADGTITYTPYINFNGSDTITYSVSDSSNNTSPAVVMVNVTPVNDAPIAGDDSATTDEDTPVTINVLANDSDVENDELSIIGADALNGSVQISADGTITYTPNANFNGSDTITYTISDGNGGTTTATVAVTVNAVNDAPTAVDSTATTDEDTPVTLSVLDNATDVEGDTLTVTTASATNGTVTINADGTITYTPNANFNGSDTITYTVSDGNDGTTTATVAVTVNAVNDAPTANDDTAITDEDTPIVINVLDNDSDTDGDPLSVTQASATNGNVIINADGTLTYTPNANFNGTDTISYTIRDSSGATSSATVAVTVNAINDAPITHHDTAVTQEDTSISLDVLANDSDIEGDTLAVTTVSATNGTVTINADGTITYTPNANFNGSDTITYTVSDGNGGSTTATVAVTVNAVNDAPTAVDSTASTDEDVPVTLSVLDNATDIEGDTLTVTTASATNGAVTINADGTITYTPNANFNGSDTITYTVSDGNGGTTTATVAVTVNAVNDAPTATDSTASTDEDTPVTLAVLDNASDVEGDTLTVTTASATNGTVTINADGTLTYTPNANFSDSDTITYTVSDGNGGITTATVAVTVNAVNDAPTAVDSTASTDEDTPITLSVLDNASDVEGDTLTVTTASATNGTVTINADGTITYTPDANFNGSDTITYTVSDGNGGTTTVTVAVSVNAVNDAPTAVDSTASTDEDTPVTLSVLDNATDVEGDTLTVTTVSATNGTVTINADGTITYTPNTNFNGSDTITYTVSDGNGGTTTATVAVTVNAINDAPTATDSMASTDEDTPVTLAVLNNATDVEGDTLTITAASATNGTVAINADGTITYTPNTNFNGSDTITYTVSDGNGSTTTATVAVSVNAVNDAPTATDSTASTDEDTPVTLSVLDNATGVEDDTLTVTTASATNGTVSINADGTITYIPNANFNGSDTIIYTVSDGNGSSTTATVAVTVTAVNDAPTATDSTASTDEDTPVTLSVLDNASDVEDDTLTVTTASATNGAVTINADGTITYTPNANFNGSDTITYTVSDGNGGTTTSTVAVTVNAINNAPELTSALDLVSTEQGSSINIDVLSQVTDADGDSLNVAQVSAENGTVTINADGTITYTPDPLFNGTETITVTVTDTNGGELVFTQTITVLPVDLPTQTISATIISGGTLSVNVPANAVGMDTSNLSVVNLQSEQGSVQLSDSVIIFTHNSNLTSNQAVISYTVTDGVNARNVNVLINVLPVQSQNTELNNLLANIDQNRLLSGFNNAFAELSQSSDINTFEPVLLDAINAIKRLGGTTSLEQSLLDAGFAASTSALNTQENVVNQSIGNLYDQQQQQFRIEQLGEQTSTPNTIQLEQGLQGLSLNEQSTGAPLTLAQQFEQLDQQQQREIIELIKALS
ncbi:Ig-like domain-containing protein [Celerinatantimonas sp. MCCC 1A17872]|uniref:Ig-like domain-containing protein n=1 Tax=Celerinatantimonas sp. MCCC 1A17872 TaxID=3177514 RepID=UPI0038C0F851